MSTKEEDFKQRLAAVLQDVQQNGVKDQEAMLLLGGLAADLTRNLKAKTWSEAKQNIGAEAYDALLKTFEKEGNEHYKAGNTRHAYAIQILAVSLVARTQRRDPDMQAGEALLDAIINAAAAAQPKLN